ncbi:methyltransferase domain-containing protein [Archangium minus]|uniref:Methyltransferase domain-containing protein n=1 Tax=Archangium minus TaxID=83450 RepID=A0ABY9WNT6_9BACT|nr:methyltransferase domain-containing protein [Archangium minus]
MAPPLPQRSEGGASSGLRQSHEIHGERDPPGCRQRKERKGGLPVADKASLALDFRNIDRTQASTEAVRFLDNLNATQQVQEIQRLTHRLLGACEGAHVLDAGCGVGDVTRELGALVGRTGRVTGVDLSEAMVAEARRRTEGLGLPVEFRHGNIHQLDFPSESFDGCRASRVFIYLEDPRQALSELLRLTRPGGTVVLFEPEMDSLVLDGPDRAVVRKLVHFWADQLRNPWVGRRIPGLFRSLGVTELSVTPVAGTWTLSTMEAFGLHPILGKAVQSGVATANEVAEWLQFMKERDQEGSFYGAVTGMVVRGIKPID